MPNTTIECCLIFLGTVILRLSAVLFKQFTPVIVAEPLPPVIVNAILPGGTEVPSAVCVVNSIEDDGAPATIANGKFVPSMIC